MHEAQEIWEEAFGFALNQNLATVEAVVGLHPTHSVLFHVCLPNEEQSLWHEVCVQMVSAAGAHKTTHITTRRRVSFSTAYDMNIV